MQSSINKIIKLCEDRRVNLNHYSEVLLSYDDPVDRNNYISRQMTDALILCRYIVSACKELMDGYDAGAGHEYIERILTRSVITMERLPLGSMPVNGTIELLKTLRWIDYAILIRYNYENMAEIIDVPSYRNIWIELGNPIYVRIEDIVPLLLETFENRFVNSELEELLTNLLQYPHADGNVSPMTLNIMATYFSEGIEQGREEEQGISINHEEMNPAIMRFFCLDYGGFPGFISSSYAIHILHRLSPISMNFMVNRPSYAVYRRITASYFAHDTYLRRLAYNHAIKNVRLNGFYRNLGESYGLGKVSISNDMIKPAIMEVYEGLTEVNTNTVRPRVEQLLKDTNVTTYGNLDTISHLFLPKIVFDPSTINGHYDTYFSIDNDIDKIVATYD